MSEILFDLSIISILAQESWHDLQTRECPDYFHLLFILLAIVSPWKIAFGERAIGALLVGIVFLTAAILSKGKLGGADIKLSACVGFVFGWRKALFGLCLGIAMACLCEFKNRKEPFPLIPYLAEGTLFISMLVRGGT